MENRKVIQLIYVKKPMHQDHLSYDLIYALVDDGTIWWSNLTGGVLHWQQDCSPV